MFSKRFFPRVIKSQTLYCKKLNQSSQCRIKCILFKVCQRFSDPKNRCYRIISVISVVLRETTLTISDLTSEPVSKESEIVRVVSLSTAEISEIIRLKIQSSVSEYLNNRINRQVTLDMLIEFTNCKKLPPISTSSDCAG